MAFATTALETAPSCLDREACRHSHRHKTVGEQGALLTAVTPNDIDLVDTELEVSPGNGLPATKGFIVSN